MAKPYYLAFPIPEKQERKTRDVIEKIRTDATRKSHIALLADTVIELSDMGLNYLFVYPLERANAGYFTIKSAQMGLGIAQKAINGAVRKVIKGMGKEQLFEVANFLEEVMIEKKD